MVKRQDEGMAKRKVDERQRKVPRDGYITHSSSFWRSESRPDMAQDGCNREDSRLCKEAKFEIASLQGLVLADFEVPSK